MSTTRVQAIIHDAKGFVFTSSIAVYGANQVPMTEELVPKPEDPYGISKYAVELDLAAAHHMFGLPYIILPARKEVVHAVASHEKLQRYFSPPPPVSLDEGLSRMAQWVLKQGPRAPVGMSAIEVMKGLPPSWLPTH